MRALVTGGAGFIGSHIADRLLERGYEVRVLDALDPRVHPRGRPDYLDPDVELVVGDVADAASVARALRGVQVVFHMAAYQDSMPDFSRFLRDNAAGTALIYETIVAERLPVRKVVVASSQAVYGEGQYACDADGPFQAEPRDPERLARGRWDVTCPRCGREAVPLPLEEDAVNPANAYGISKLAQEMIALRLGRRHGIPSVALRYSIAQGPRQSPDNAYSGVLRIFAQRLLQGRAPILYEDGLQQRDYVHVDDLVEATLLALDDPRADYQALNVGGRRVTTVRQYAKVIAEALGWDGEPIQTGEYRAGDARHSVSSVDRIAALGWRPRKTLEHIVADYLAWIRSRPLDAGATERADRSLREHNVVLPSGHADPRAAAGRARRPRREARP